ncbi:MAG: DUF4105 domain-containing protein [Bacteroidales bacterium]|nr:DUF4105 domain-containing protein [Bacteroidales bacterium]
MRTRILILLLILFPLINNLSAQNRVLGPESTISLLTCGPGPDVYSYFGHSALRVKDSALNIDRVYNYGTFDFSDPHFYAHFINGKLHYLLSVVRYRGFFPDYVSEKRFIKELPLNLTLDTRNELFNLLEINYMPENRYYWYDFFTDNCSTRIRDIVVKATRGTVTWPAEPNEHLTYRELIMPYIGLNKWAKAGILLLLTAGADQEITQDGYMFLPDHMHRLFTQAKLSDGTPLCQPERVIFLPDYPKPVGTGIVHPYVIFSLLLLLGWFMILFKKIPLKAVKSFFSMLFFISGALGFLFCYMWFFSAHQVCHANLNLAWAFPFNLTLATTIWMPKARWINRRYSRAMALLIILFLITFSFFKQQIPLEAILFSLTILPGLLFFSGLKQFRKPKAQNQTN